MSEECSKPKKIMVQVYIVLSLLLIGFFAFNYMKSSVYRSGYQAAQLDTLRALFAENERAQCKPIVVSAGKDKNLELIDVKCLQQQAPGAQAQGAPAPAPVSTESTSTVQ